MEDMLFKAVASLAILLITGYLLPYIKTKIGSENFKQAVGWAEKAVSAAEQLYTESGMGMDKYSFAANFLSSKGIKLTDDDLQIIIEGAVKAMNTAKSMADAPDVPAPANTAPAADVPAETAQV